MCDSFYNLPQLPILMLPCILYACFYYNFQQLNVDWKVIKVVLHLDNSFRDWGDCCKAWNECINLPWWIRQINEADLDLFELTPWLWVSWNKRYYEKQWLNKAFTENHWLFISWKNFASKPNHTVAILKASLKLFEVTPY